MRKRVRTKKAAGRAAAAQAEVSAPAGLAALETFAPEGPTEGEQAPPVLNQEALDVRLAEVGRTSAAAERPARLLRRSHLTRSAKPRAESPDEPMIMPLPSVASALAEAQPAIQEADVETVVVNVGEIRGKVGVVSSAVVSVPMHVSVRLHVRTTLESTIPGVTVCESRGNGPNVDVRLAIAARRSGKGHFRVHCAGEGHCVEGIGTVVIDLPDPAELNLRGVIGQRVSADVPVPESIWQRKTYFAYLEPRRKEMWLSANRGVFEAGSQVMPFKLMFQASSAKPVSSVLVVELDKDIQFTVRVTGQCGGFGEKRWAHA